MRTPRKDLEPYTQMARYYDLIYHCLVDYRAECDFLGRLFKRHFKKKVRRILDVGCGTGNHSVILADRGFKVVGIDRSEAMLKIARAKTTGSQGNLRFEKMDMRRINLRETFDAVLILFGGFTYLLTDSDVEKCLSSVRKQLNKGGLLIFEFWHSSGLNPAASTSYGFRTWDRIENKRKHQLMVRLSTSWYNPLTNRLNPIFDHYLIDTKNNRLLDHFQETHVMRTYNVSEIKRLLHESDLVPIAFYAKGNEEPPKPPTHSTPRIICVASPINAS